MRFKTLAKILIIVFIVVIALTGIRSCSNAVARRRIAQQPINAQPVQPVPQVANIPVQQVPVQQQPQQVVSIKPVQDVAVSPEQGKTLLTRKKGEFTVWNVTTEGDTIPLYPAVYNSTWTSGSEANNYKPRDLTNENVFERTTLTRIRFYVQIDKPGDYIALGKAWRGVYDGAALVSLRINDAAIVPLTSDLATGYVKLEKGLYLFDIRYVNTITNSYNPGNGFVIKLKGPGENEPAIIGAQDIYWKEDVKNAGTAEQIKSAK